MKRAFKSILVMGLIFSLPFLSQAQPPEPPHPNGGEGPGSGNSVVGGTAPIDGGLTMMLLLGLAYGSRKVYRMKK